MKKMLLFMLLFSSTWKLFAQSEPCATEILQNIYMQKDSGVWYLRKAHENRVNYWRSQPKTQSRFSPGPEGYGMMPRSTDYKFNQIPPCILQTIFIFA